MHHRASSSSHNIAELASINSTVLIRYKDGAWRIANAPRPPAAVIYVPDAESSDVSPVFSSLETYLVAAHGLIGHLAELLVKAHEGLVNSQDAESQRPNLAVWEKRLIDLESTIYAKFYAFRYDQVPSVLRVMYADVLILLSYYKLLVTCIETASDVEGTLDYIVEKLDRALITSGQAGTLGGAWIEKTLVLLDDAISDNQKGPPAKRQRQQDNFFSEEEPYGRPIMTSLKECQRHAGWSLDRFEDYMNAPSPPKPLVFTDLLCSWPALTDRPWKSIPYLLSRTLGGRRLVPVEVGRSYVDSGWSQELMPFGQFLDKHVLNVQGERGYLAQHNLLEQIPVLRRDIAIPDLCWADVPPHPTDPSKNQAKLESPSLNAWFGPAGTITPLHTDAYHNLLAQVVGRKYVRLYPPRAGSMRPRGEEHGVDMSNTSAVDLGVVEGWDEMPEDGDAVDEIERDREALEGAEYWDCLLEPGDTLLIPMGWWHYVRSLSVSFSVSFWWN